MYYLAIISATKVNCRIINGSHGQRNNRCQLAREKEVHINSEPGSYAHDRQAGTQVGMYNGPTTAHCGDTCDITIDMFRQTQELSPPFEAGVCLSNGGRPFFLNFENGLELLFRPSTTSVRRVVFRAKDGRIIITN